MQYQQGDVYIERINEEIKEKKICKIKKRGWIIAEGETHGHAHRIEDVKNAEMYEYYDEYLEEKCLLLKILKNNTEMKHEEHKSIFLDEGLYRVGQINEYDPFEKYERKVMD